MHPILRNIAHCCFPFLVKPYRRVRDGIIGLAQFPDELRDIRRIREKRYEAGSDDLRFYEKFYSSDTVSNNIVDGAVYMADGRMLHGGLTDRIRGILTTYEYLRDRGIPFFIHWVHPFNLEDYLVPSGAVDWRISPEKISFSRREAFPVVIMESLRPQTHVVNRLRLKMALSGRLRQTHIYSNADNAKGQYRRLYAELFKPSELLQREVDRHLGGIGAKYWTMTFRCRNLLGDFEEHDNTVLAPDEQAGFMDRLMQEFRAIAENLPKGYKVLVTSDSKKLLDFMKARDRRIYVVPGDVKNIDLMKGEYRAAWLKTFIDQQLIMHAERVYLMQTGSMYKSGFPRFAAEIGGKPFIYHQF